MKKVLSIALVVITLAVCLVSCSSSSLGGTRVVDVLVSGEVVPEPDYFTIVYSEGDFDVFVHNETGVMYLWCKVCYAGGLTVMVDADGKPLLYTPDVEVIP